MRDCFACGKPGHIAIHCPQHTSQISGQQKLATSEPIVGDASGSHRVCVVIDNHQVEHQATIVETSGVIGGISCLVLFDSGALDYFISPFLVER